LKEIKIYRDELKYKIALSEAAPFVGANYIWNISISGLNITGENYSVCIVDTGVNSSHPALLNKIIAQMDFCADNSNCITNDTVAEDANGHGTHVAGIIASQDSYSKGIAPGANLVIAKA
ncbi:MAG: S8 family serine peptidase, partial [Candidatus Nanoarchaeia archaeon]